MRLMETNSSSWVAEIIAFVAVICGLIGAWVKDRLSLAHRLTKLETRQDQLIDQVAQQNTLMMELLKEWRRDHPIE